MQGANVRIRRFAIPPLLRLLSWCLALAFCCIAGPWASPYCVHSAASARESPEAPAAARDWNKHPAIIEMATPYAVYAFGDVHGDYHRLVQLLTAAGIIAKVSDSPAAVQWNAGPAVLVCTGDLIDKWDHSVQVVALFQALQQGAENKGGRVIVTMGNHEADFLADPNGEKIADFAKELRKEGPRAYQRRPKVPP